MKPYNYDKGLSTEENAERAIAHYKSFGKNPEAIFHLGNVYLHMKGDKEKAIECFYTFSAYHYDRYTFNMKPSTTSKRKFI